MLSSYIDDLPITERHRVAVADDDAEFLDIFQEVVSEFKEIELRTALSGGEILKNLWNALEYDRSQVVCFLDIRMETVSAGIDVLSELRSSETYRLTPVIIMSSSDVYEDVVRSYRAGANAYMYKPIGYRRKAELIRESIIYWTKFASVPQITLPLRNNSSELTIRASDRGKGSASWILDRIRQDILVGLLKDLEFRGVLGYSDKIEIEVEKVFIRISELFAFRGSYLSNKPQEFSSEMLELFRRWRLIKGTASDAIAQRRTLLNQLKIARRHLSGSLRTVSTHGKAAAAFNNLEYLVWDIFSELRSYPSLFPHLNRSLSRFVKRIA